jgi:hypothetical protein
MFQQRRVKYHRFGWIPWGVAVLLAAQGGFGAEQTTQVGTLHIEGEGIVRLVLQGSTGPRLFFYSREPNLVLPADTYRLEEIVLQGSYSSSGLQIPSPARVLKIEPGGFVTVKLGPPLRQTIKIERWGRSLVLNYQLLGCSGESYTVTRRQGKNPPTFVIDQGGNNIASDNFAAG